MDHFENFPRMSNQEESEPIHHAWSRVDSKFQEKDEQLQLSQAIIDIVKRDRKHFKNHELDRAYIDLCANSEAVIIKNDYILSSLILSLNSREEIDLNHEEFSKTILPCLKSLNFDKKNLIELLRAKMDPFKGTQIPQEKFLQGIIKNIEHRQEMKRVVAINKKMEVNPQHRVENKDLKKLIEIMPEYLNQPITCQSELIPLKSYLEMIVNDQLEITDESQVTIIGIIDDLIQKIRQKENTLKAIKHNIEIG